MVCLVLYTRPSCYHFITLICVPSGSALNAWIFFTDGDPASQILQYYSDRISQVSLTDSCIQLLYTEGLINEETQRKIERCGGSLSDSLRELMITVSEDHSKLRSLGDILLNLEETKSVAQEMIKDCGEYSMH